jgi:hypothetical protein
VIRPRVQESLACLLGDLGSKGLTGRDGWVFYRPGVRYLVEPARPAGAPGPRSAEAVRAILRFRGQLRERGIHLLVVPVPGKASVYPEMVSRRAAGAGHAFRSPTEAVLAELRGHAVETVDLFAAFRRERGYRPGLTGALYLAQDTHWTPAGAAIAAGEVARRLQQLNWAPSPNRQYRTLRVRVARRGDVLEMLRAHGLTGLASEEVVHCEQVLDPSAGLMVPGGGRPSGTYSNDHLKDTASQASVLVLGDSFCRIYQTPEPRSLGRVLAGNAATRPVSSARGVTTRKLLPGSAGFCSLLARELGAAVDYVYSDGGAATAVRMKLSTNAEILENKRVVVWEFAERDLGLGGEGWQDVPLPPAPQQAAPAAALP